ncbi:SUMF1/EgtB/PvdO family nonheme iron enzyme [Tengunoibacter tsumagoiensis]|nr:SUMF1/EgtB/PvdO family nonheme iron enzyme [Tengunoibacter tsumagoiensis]
MKTLLPAWEAWDHFSTVECERVAEVILNKVPPSFQYEQLTTFALGDQRHRILVFTWTPPASREEQGPLRFAFLPGGQATLGYDRTHPFIPTAAQAESWQKETIERGYTNDSLDVFLDRILTPFRQVEIPPLLMQMSPSDGDAPPILVNGRLTPQRSVSLQRVRETVLADGFRLPTSDEWEYACGAGTRALFRWGDITPNHRPVRFRPFSQSWEEFLSGLPWRDYVQPNAFGLQFSQNGYQWEMCQEIDMMRAGDGGIATHLGAGILAEWLPLATSFVTKLSDFELRRQMFSEGYFRRVYPL